MRFSIIKVFLSAVPLIKFIKVKIVGFSIKIYFLMSPSPSPTSILTFLGAIVWNSRYVETHFYTSDAWKPEGK